MPRGRSRKRQRPKTLNDKSGPKDKKVRKKEESSITPEIEVVNEDNEDIQFVSRYILIFMVHFIKIYIYVYLYFIVYFNY